MIRPVALLLALLQGASAPPAPDYPFAVGETLTYSAKLGMLTLGQGTLQVAALDSLRGREAFRFRLHFHQAGARHDHGVDIGIDTLAVDDTGHRAQILYPCIGA